MAHEPHDDRLRHDEPRVLARVREPESREPRLSFAASIVILGCLVTFTVAGMSIPSPQLGSGEDGGRTVAAAIVASAAFVVAVVTFAFSALRAPRR